MAPYLISLLFIILDLNSLCSVPCGALMELKVYGLFFISEISLRIGMGGFMIIDIHEDI